MQNGAMAEYRRNRIPGGTYFFTVNLFDRRSDLLLTHINVLRDAVRRVRESRPFHIDAWVVLPDHMHAVWTLPPGDVDYASRWKAIKAVFSRRLPRDETIPTPRLARGERGVWQRRYWEHTIRDEADYTAHVDYVHINPLKHGLVAHVRDWPYSSFHRCVGRGMYALEWAGDGADDVESGKFGERPSEA
jgi:putative transposase